MKLVPKAATAAIAIMTASVTALPAYAATVIYDGTSYNPNDAIVINFTGVQDPNSSGTLTLTFTGTGTGAQANDYLFTYSLSNTSTSPSTNISGFGFNITDIVPSSSTFDLATSFSTGTYTYAADGSISGGYSVDFCAASNQNSCAGGSNNGPTPGGTASGTIGLEFSSLPESFTITQPVIRMQNTGPTGGGSDIGLPGGVPEPATWAMMLVGFTGIGFAMRRRRKLGLLQVA